MILKNNLLKYLLGLFVIITFCSCEDYKNEIWINEDGSGKVEMSYDMSSMISMMQMMEGMEGMDEEDSGEDVEEENSDNEEITEDNFMSIFDNMGEGMAGMEDLDTTLVVYDVMPDSVKQKLSNPELMKKMSFSFYANKAESSAMFNMSVEYDSKEERDQIFDSFAEMAEGNDADAQGKIEDFKQMIRQYDLDLEKGVVLIPEQDFTGDFAEGMGDQDMDFENMDEEELAMMEMMMGDAGILTTIHLPSEVISCDDKSAKIDGKTITFKDSYMDLLKDKKMKGREIKFKK